MRGTRFAIAIVLAAALAVLGAWSPTRVRAQSETYDARIAAAVDAFEHERWDEARAAFEDAHALIPSPRTLRGIGMCAVEQHDWGTAYHVLAQALALHDDAHPLTPALRTQTESLLARARRHVGLYTVPGSASVTLDGAPVEAEPDGSVALTEGAHLVVLSTSDGRRVERTLAIEGGEGPTSLPIDPGSFVRGATITPVGPSSDGTTSTTTQADTTQATEGAVITPVGDGGSTTPSSTSTSSASVPVIEPGQHAMPIVEQSDEEVEIPVRSIALELALFLGGGTRNSRANGGLSGCFGVGAMVDLMFRLDATVWIGANLDFRWASLTEADRSSYAAMLGNSEARAWLEGDADLVTQIHVSGTPLVLVGGVGYALVYRDSEVIDATGMRPVHGVTAHGLDVLLEARLYFLDDRLFVAGQGHFVASDLPAVEGGLVLGGAPL